MTIKTMSEAVSKQSSQSRIQHIDGLRGLAIILVIIVHAYSRYPDLYPFKNQFDFLNIYNLGRNGVNLFFIISGYVIFMTLEKCKNFKEFMFKRWIRLFPAMLFCSLFVYITAGLLNNRPLGQPSLQDLLPGLTFIQPEWWQFFLHDKQGILEGAFWSLFVEMKFYIVAGLLYFYLTKKNIAWLIFGLFIVCFLTFKIATKLSISYDELWHYFSFLDLNYFGWFASGMFFYSYKKTHHFYYYALAVFSAILGALHLYGFATKPFIIALLLIAVFSTSLIFKKLQKLLSFKPLLFLGAISYPLYLMHENMMVSLTISLGNLFPNIPAILLPVLPILFVILLAYFIAIYFEPQTKNLTKKLVGYF
jgi:peptidoglycan/LPS O-acetylase OafA/YrhL